MVSETNPLVRARRRAGRVKRWAKRRLHERNIGREYAPCAAQAADVRPGTESHLTTISILVPVYDPPADFLRQCLGSVVSQSARNWQLVIADDGWTRKDVLDVLAEFRATHASDPRITLIRKDNGGISSALNAALERATGDYMGMLDHDDVLGPVHPGVH